MDGSNGRTSSGGRELRHPQPGTGWPEAVLLLGVGTALAFLRLGRSAFEGRIWAEDGRVFLQQAYDGSAFRAVFDPYAGYLSGVPRLAAIAVTALPLPWQGVGLHVAAALVQALVGVVAYAATADLIAQRWGRVVVLVCVVAVPVGTEVVGNISNLQWFLVFGAGVALCWTPRSWRGWLACALVMAGAVLSSPFGFVLVGCTLVRCVLQRQRPVVIVSAVTAIAFAIQSVAMLQAPERAAGPVVPGQREPAALLRGYLARVAGDGVLGVGRHEVGALHPSITGGAVVLLVLVALSGLLAITGRFPGGRAVPLLLGLSVATFLLPLMLGSTTLANPFAASRYYVTPALFFQTALIVCCARALSAIDRHASAASWASRVLAAGLLAALAFGVVTSYSSSSLRQFEEGAGWGESVRAAREQCAALDGGTHVVIPILPPGWTVSVRCADLGPH